MLQALDLLRMAICEGEFVKGMVLTQLTIIKQRSSCVIVSFRDCFHEFRPHGSALGVQRIIVHRTVIVDV
jgi:hypothetical protein